MFENEQLERILTGYGLLNGPLWNAESSSLFFADASNGGAYELLAGGQINCVVPHRRGIGGLAPHAQGGLVVGGRNVAWRSGDRNCVLAELDPTLGMTRFNDLGTDRRGRLFAGSLEFNPGNAHAGRPGFLHVVELDGISRVVDENIRQANGIAASPRGDRLYVADTLAKAIWSYEIRSDGELGKRSPLIEWSLGEPDGIAMSCDGALWIALREEWCIAVVEPDGRERRRIPAPPGKLTALCFGGPDYRTLFVTTGTFSDSKGGSIYRCQVEETGEPVTPCRVPITPAGDD
jgi:gluconolactonase